MKKTKKVQLLAAALGVMATVTGFALINNPVQAKAAEETATATFAMTKGSAVRAVKDQAGIRWETTVNQAWFNNVASSLEEGQTITNYSFGTWVTSANNVNSVTELNENFTNEVSDLPCEVTPDFKTQTTFTYYSSIVYTAEDLAGYTDEEVKKAYAAELIARSYMKYTLNDGTTAYAYATSNDNQRCMRSVALAAYQETNPNKALTDAQKQVVDDYFGKDNGTVTDFSGYYETESTGITSDYTAIYYQAIKIGKVNADDKLEITSKLTLGRNYTVTLFDDDGNYAKTTFQYITALLDNDNFDDYINVSDKINGYYVLGSNIDLGGTYYGVSNTFAGTLDGNGKTISGIKYAWVKSAPAAGGLFKNLEGTIKNVSIVGANANQGGLIADICNAEATIENVYVNATLSVKNSGAIVRWVQESANITMKNVVIMMTRTNTTSTTATPGAVFAFMTKNCPMPTLEDCYYITDKGLASMIPSSTTYWSAADAETIFGTATISGNVTAYANGLTGYYGATTADAKDAFDAAVGTTLSPELQAMMYPTTATN